MHRSQRENTHKSTLKGLVAMRENEADFIAEFGITYDQADDWLCKLKIENQKKLNDIIEENKQIAKKQSLRSKIEWFINLDRRKKELMRLRNGR